MSDNHDSMDNDECGMSEKDHYVESRFELNEKLKRMENYQLIAIINKMIDFTDGVSEMGLEITEGEHRAIIELLTNNEEEETDE